MGGLDLFEKLSLLEVAQILEIHPFELARLLGAKGEMPAQLRFDESQIGHLRSLAGVEVWWDGGALPVEDSSRNLSLVRSLAHLVVERKLPGGEATRADNLFRGLNADDASFVRRVVNQLIRDGLATSHASPRGLLISMSEAQAEAFRGFAGGGPLTPTLEALCRQ